MDNTNFYKTIVTKDIVLQFQPIFFTILQLQPILVKAVTMYRRNLNSTETFPLT